MSEDRILAELSAIRTELSAVRTEVNQLRAGQDRLRVEVMARIDRLQDVVGQVRDDMSVNYSAWQIVAERQANARHEQELWTNLVAGMQRQIAKLNERVSALEEKS